MEIDVIMLCTHRDLLDQKKSTRRWWKKNPILFYEINFPLLLPFGLNLPSLIVMPLSSSFLSNFLSFLIKLWRNEGFLLKEWEKNWWNEGEKLYILNYFTANYCVIPLVRQSLSAVEQKLLEISLKFKRELSAELNLFALTLKWINKQSHSSLIADNKKKSTGLDSWLTGLYCGLTWFDRKSQNKYKNYNIDLSDFTLSHL